MDFLGYFAFEVLNPHGHLFEFLLVERKVLLQRHAFGALGLELRETILISTRGRRKSGNVKKSGNESKGIEQNRKSSKEDDKEMYGDERINTLVLRAAFSSLSFATS